MNRLTLSAVLALLGTQVSGCAPATYEKSCKAPLAGWRTEKDILDHHGMPFELTIDANGNLFIGKKGKKTNAELISDLKQLATLNPVPQLVLNPASAAPCVRVKEVRAIMETSAICQGMPNHFKCFEGRPSHIGPYFR